ncbi:hypothetical protein LOAG_13003, partial [Loa loa]
MYAEANQQIFQASEVDGDEEVITARDDEDGNTDFERDSNATQMDSSGSEYEWQLICGEFEKKLEAVQKDTAVQLTAFEAMRQTLAQAEKKIESLQVLLAQKERENADLLGTIENLQLKSVEELEKQKVELMRSADENLMAAEQMYCASQAKVSQLEALVEKTYIDNTGLREQLDRALTDLNNAKSGPMDPKEFYRQLKKRLKIITEKFRMEAVDSDLTWMGEENVRYALDGFEAAAKAILADDPHLRPLAERLIVFLEERNVEMEMQTTPPEDNVTQEYPGNLDKALMDFKNEMGEEMHFVLKKFQENQSKGLYEMILKIINHLDIAEQKADNNLAKRMDHLMGMIASINGKNSDLEKIKKEIEDINVKLETLFETFDEFRHDIKVLNEEHKDESENMKSEQLKLKTTCAYVDYLSGQHMKLEKQISDVEAFCDNLKQEFCSTPMRKGAATQTVVSIAHAKDFKSDESLNVTTACSIMEKTVNMVKKNGQHAEHSAGHGTHLQIKKKGNW